MANIRKPRYKYGLLESPMSSYFSSSGNELSTTLQTDETISHISKDVSYRPSGANVRMSTSGNIADSSPEVTNISHISSIQGDLRGRSTEKTYNTDTLLASGEESAHEGDKSTVTPRNSLSAGRSSSPHVFQLPKAPAPRKTPRYTPTIRSQSTPRSRPHNVSSSGGSRSETLGTPRHSKKTPRSCRSDAAETPRIVDSANIVSIVEGRGQARGEIGMASIDLKHPVVEISQFADSQTYVKTISRLQILSPVEIIFPNTMYDAGSMVKLFRVVSDNFQNSNITTVQRHYFNETKGMDCIKNLGVKEHSSVEMDVQRKYYCLAATAALIKYVEFIENTMFANHSLKIVFKGSDQTTLIDSSTAAILELVINTQDPNLRECLGRFDVDVDSLLTSIVTIPKHDTERIVESKITACILLKHILQLMPVLENILSDGESELLRAYNAALKDARFKIITQLAEIHNLPIKCAYNASRGFFIQMSLTEKGRKAPQLPPVFLKVTKNRSTISCTTDDLICMNGKINQAVKSIYGMANEVVSDLLADVRGSVGCLYKLSEIISMLDVLVSLAHVATVSEYVRPEFTDTLAIKKGQHPILEKISGRSKSVPNDVYIADEANFLILTGPNMSGKSTLLKQVALLQVMAQIGSFVPAEYASFRIADQIFSRVGSDDDMETNSSSFTLEMKEMNYIIQNVTDNSLVIIDELGRGTSSEEGVGICWAIAEFLLSQKAFTLFATHFLEICRLESLYPNVENMHFKIDHVTTMTGNLYKILYTYVLSRGHCDEKHYGLQLAEYSNLPKSVIEKAWEIARSLDQGKEQMDMEIAGRYCEEKAIYRYAHRLLQISRSCVLEGEALRSLFKNLRDDFLVELASCNNGTSEQLEKSCNTHAKTTPSVNQHTMSDVNKSQQEALQSQLATEPGEPDTERGPQKDTRNTSSDSMLPTAQINQQFDLTQCDMPSTSNFPGDCANIISGPDQQPSIVANLEDRVFSGGLGKEAPLRKRKRHDETFIPQNHSDIPGFMLTHALVHRPPDDFTSTASN